VKVLLYFPPIYTIDSSLNM